MMPTRKPPVREQIATELRSRIGTGRYAVGTQLPTIRELAAEFHCVDATAHAALRLLAADGLVEIKPRRGAVVLPSISGVTERLHRSAHGGLFRDGESPQILAAGLTSDCHPEALAGFGLDEGARLGARRYVVVNAKGVPVTLGTSYVHPEVWDEIPELQAVCAIPDGIIGAVRRAQGIITTEGPTKRMAAVATDEEAAGLEIERDQPVLVEVTECRALDGTLVEWNISVHPSGYWVGG